MDICFRIPVRNGWHVDTKMLRHCGRCSGGFGAFDFYRVYNQEVTRLGAPVVQKLQKPRSFALTALLSNTAARAPHRFKQRCNG
jgi:hypothetical protein